MSDKNKDDDICRDFLRNVCRRGKRCKYRHPDEDEGGVGGHQKQSYVFCHDYQNKGCDRNNCKFIHCTKEEEDFYKQTGELPSSLQKQPGVGGGSAGPGMLGLGASNGGGSLGGGDIPICRDFLKNECHRGSKCKFRHVAQDEYDYPLSSRDSLAPEPPLPSYTSRYDSYEPRFDDYEYDRLRLKRRRDDLDFDYRERERDYEPPRPRPLDYRFLEDENIMLRRKIDELKKQVSDLQATNEVLLEQNARYRTERALQRSGTPPRSENLPVTNYNHGIISQAITHTISHASVTNPQIPQAPSVTQLNSASLNQAQSRGLAQDLLSGPNAAASAAAIPISHQGSTLPVSVAQAIASVAQQGLVSYPIMTGNMRTAMAQSSLSQSLPQH
ncbi:zinc finger CCCH domain-containing protein 10-like [Branchiostoma lanceolatum]|uniref:Zinc finger CCCH domain-containing protein 10 n=1 Tax=Branchiostoma lanceolatum TaxID=7740 RepID=A0A8J9VGW4_BRALA|nr:ZC3H10 [Branchiostoma lanceolatum]